MDYKGHPIIDEEPHPNSNENAERMRREMAAFHEKRGHGAIQVHLPPKSEVRTSESSTERVDDQSSTDVSGNPRGLPNGIWTVEGPRGHRTFRISTVLAPTAPQAPEYSPASQGDLTFRERHHGKRVLEMLTGPDNTSNYKGLAWVVDPATRNDGSCVGKLWKLGLQNVVLVNTFCKLVERDEQLAGYTVHFARHCYKCNRLLTTPESIQRGIGPVCARGGWD